MRFSRKKDWSEELAHDELSDMPDITGVNSDHDARYLVLSGTNANVDIDIGSYSLTTSGTFYGGIITDNTAILSGGSLTNVKLGSLTSNGFVKTSGGDGTLSIDTNTYLTSVAHTDLTDMPSSSNSDHDGRYYTETEIGSTSSGTSGCSLIGIPCIDTPTWTKQCHFNNLFGSAGRASGGTITLVSGTTVNVAAGTGFIKATDSDTAELLSFDWSANNGIGVPTDSVRYIGVQYGDPPVVVSSDNQNWDYDTTFPLGSVINQADDLYIMNDPWWVTDGITNIIERFQSQGTVRDDFIGGLILGTSSSNTTRKPTLTGGTVWSRLNEFAIGDKDCSTGTTFYGFYRDGGTGWTRTIAKTDIDDFYDDDSGTLHALDNNKYVNFWVFAQVDTANNGQLMIIYPQNQYNTAADAEAEVIPVFPSIWYKHGVLVGRIIIKKGVTAPIKISTSFNTIFGYALAADHTNLSNLAWSASGHTSISLSSFAGFDGAGAATTYTESNYLLTSGTRDLSGDWTISTNSITLSSGTLTANTFSLGDDKEIQFGATAGGDAKLRWDSSDNRLWLTTPQLYYYGAQTVDEHTYRIYNYQTKNVTAGDDKNLYNMMNYQYIYGGSNYTGTHMGFFNYMRNYNTATVSRMYGVSGQVINYSTGTINDAYGDVINVNNNSTGTIDDARGVYAQVSNNAAGTINTAYSSYNLIQNITGGTTTTAYNNYNLIQQTGVGGVITNAYGAYFKNPIVSNGSITSYTGIYIEHPTTAGTNTPIYVADGVNESYLGGHYRIPDDRELRLGNTAGGDATIKWNNTDNSMDLASDGIMTFTDAVTGTRTLKTIGCPVYHFIKATNQSEGDLHLSSGTTWNVNKALISSIRVVTSGTSWNLYLLQNDNGHAVNDANIPALTLMNGGNGNADISLQMPYEDEDASTEVHLNFSTIAGSGTADIYVIGWELV